MFVLMRERNRGLSKTKWMGGKVDVVGWNVFGMGGADWEEVVKAKPNEFGEEIRAGSQNMFSEWKSEGYVEMRDTQRIGVVVGAK